ncbi:MAG TPA: glycoside hydrolase family 15 protein [Roseiflexaceae bacterium]|nr:glycoside hydrolase family 15 protein [Roseiflexaceae bacterium]
MKQPLKHTATLLLAAMLLGACGGSQAAAPTPPAATVAPAPTNAPTVAPTGAPTSPPSTVAAAPTAAPTPGPGVVPDQPFRIDVWTPGDKDAVGTAYTYDQPPGDANPSRVWFGLTDGAITEVAYPDVSLANAKALSLLISDGASLADEMTESDHRVERLDGPAPAFRVTSTDRAGRWQTVKQVVADPQANALIFTVAFSALQGSPADYTLYLNYVPRIGNSGSGDQARLADGVAEAWDERNSIYTALLSSPAPLLMTTGYTRKSDLPTDLKDGRLDNIYTATGAPGRLSIALQLPTDSPITLALGLGGSREAARRAAASSLTRGFEAVAAEYIAGWRRYLDPLKPPTPGLPLYSESLAALKSHEDKTHYGASVASFSMPWGHLRNDETIERGYRYVWPRDLYHVGMAMLVAGDTQSAQDILAYMDDVLQRNNGAFPQNAFVDGRTRWSSLQLDEVAMPIILAWQLKAADRYASLVKPAADFLVARGDPSTPQERWEENGGYSPATLAAVVAGLVCAADLARQAGDSAAADTYLQTADDWNSRIEGWTVTRNGPLSKEPYYLRISDGQPDGGAKLTITNGGGTHDQRAIVDQSFLELVRLGLRKPDDSLVRSTLGVIDATIRVETPKGPLFYRYPHDGYGEAKPGEAAPGKGQPWPLLLGERAVYEAARTGQPQPESLAQLASFANQGGMLPEQVFPDASATGSATPLAWAHAEYIILVHSPRDGRAADTPAVVAERYQK